MTDFQPDRLIKHLKDKWQNRPCPLCGVGNWNVSEKVFEIREFNHGDMIIGAGPIIPLIPVTCSNCGNVVLVNAIIAGIVPQGGK